MTSNFHTEKQQSCKSPKSKTYYSWSLTLKFKVQPTNAFFATVSQMFSGSFQLLTTAEHCFVFWTAIKLFLFTTDNKFILAYKYCSPPNNKGHITPVPPHNGHLLTSANFHCPQGYHCTEVQLIDIFFWEILRAFQDWHANNSKWKLYTKSVSTVIPNNMECHIHLRENLHWGNIWCLQIIWFFFHDKK